MAGQLVVAALALTFAVQASAAGAASKTLEKGLFAAGLLAFGVVVHGLNDVDRERTASAVARLRLELGEPKATVEHLRGFDRVREETYRRGDRTVLATYRNDLLVHVQESGISPDMSSPLVGEARWGTDAGAVSHMASPARVASETLDERLFRRIHEDMPFEPLSTGISAINELGSSAIILAASAGAVAFGSEDVRDTGILVGTGFAASAATTWLLKRAIGRPRPLDPEDRRSMPSGHATNAFAAATVLGHRYPSWRAPLYALATTVAFARVYLGRHYPSDVVAGAAIGVVVSSLVLTAEDDIVAFGF